MIDFDALVLQPCAEVFGEPCLYVARGAAPLAVTGVYFEGYAGQVILDTGEAGFATSNPVLGVRAAQFPSPPRQGDEIRIPRLAQAFKVQNVKADGVGDMKLELLFAADL